MQNMQSPDSSTEDCFEAKPPTSTVSIKLCTKTGVHLEPGDFTVSQKYRALPATAVD